MQAKQDRCLRIPPEYPDGRETSERSVEHILLDIQGLVVVSNELSCWLPANSEDIHFA